MVRNWFDLLIMSQHTLELRILWSSMNMESRCEKSASYDLLAGIQRLKVFLKGK